MGILRTGFLLPRNTEQKTIAAGVQEMERRMRRLIAFRFLHNGSK
jgi:hypothetical protein